MSSGVAVAIPRGDFLSERDYNHVSDNEYKKYRELAKQAQRRRAELSAESQNAYKQGDKELAHELSLKAKAELAKADQYNDKAAEYVFVANNDDSSQVEIDLHGLFVKEAEEILKKRINADLSRGASELHVIVGKGLHSKDGVAKIKPSVQKLCDEAGLNCHVDPKNTGVMIIKYSHSNAIPHWPSASQPQTQQPGYQQQPHYGGQQQQQQQPHYGGQQQQQQQQQQQGTGNTLIDSLLQLVCFCIKNYSK